MSSARPNLEKYRKRARKAAIRQRLQRMRRNIVVRTLGRSVLLALAAWCLVTYGYHLPRPMRLPPEGEPVVAFTGAHWYKAYADANGEFHNAETGLPIGQVTHWKRP